MKRILISLLLCSIVFLSSCSVNSSDVQENDPMALTATYESMVNDAMNTAIEKITQEALLNPSATAIFTQVPPTEKPQPSSTPTADVPTIAPVIPTNTQQFPTLTFTPAATATDTAYNCSIVSSSPSYNSTYSPGGDFDGKWTFKNTGTKSWESAQIDFVFISGTEFQTNVDILDLSTDVASGGTVEFIVDMLAPASTGTYSATWGLQMAGKVFCTSTIQIVVK